MMSALVISCAAATMAASAHPLGHIDHRHHHLHNKGAHTPAFVPDPKLAAGEEKLRAIMKTEEQKEEEFKEAIAAESKKHDAVDIREYKKSTAFDVKHEKHMEDSERAFEKALDKSEKSTRLKGEHSVHEFEAALEKISKNGEAAMEKLHEKSEKLQDIDIPDPTSLLQTVEKVSTHVGDNIAAIIKASHASADAARAEELTKVKAVHSQIWDDSLRMEKKANNEIRHFKQVEQHMKTEQTHLKTMAAEESQRDEAVFTKFHNDEVVEKAKVKAREDAFEQMEQAKRAKSQMEEESTHERLKDIEKQDVRAAEELHKHDFA